MRPVRLELKGFTAFRDEQTIDFEGLDLFAISGPTGSGKTSILDAITYALFGTIERVGKQAAQFVSQGQVRLAVCFEFAVDGERWRVTRTTPARGPTKIVLERRGDGEWRPAPANGVREVDAMIRDAIGLDYEAFTRTVLLPQGRFAEFLVGDAKERRAILTDLLGLELFERLGKRAGELKRDADAEAKAKATLLETEYAGVSPEAVAEAEALAKEAAQRDEALEAAEERVREVAERWAESARTIGDLESCARDLRDAAEVAERAAATLGDLTRALAEGRELVAQRTKVAAVAEKEATKAAAAREKAEATAGRATDLARLRAKAEAMLSLVAFRDEALGELEAARDRVPELAEAAERAGEGLRLAAADAEAAMEGLAAAERALEAARHADLVAAVRAGVHVGEDCPVCGAKVATLPKVPRAQPLARAQARRDDAKARAEATLADVQAAQRASDRAAADVAVAEKDVRRAETALSRATRDADAAAAPLAEAFGGQLPADPLASVDERIGSLEALEDRERAAREALDAAREELASAERERDGIAVGIAEARVRLESIPAAGLLERARFLAGDAVALPDVRPVAGADDAGLDVAAAALAEGLGGASAALAEIAAELGEGERRVLEEASGHVDGLLEEVRASTVAELVRAVAAARTSAARAAATAEDAAERMRTKLANAEAIAEQVAELRARAGVFHALSQELKADRLIAFLQVEALQLLATAGSQRLATLSAGRYRLAFDEDEFFVVDTWNGEEPRSARTLSGGETFLASLALALALSEQVRSLAVTEKARLDSLFLDEGFGTLDPESLETVVEAIEQLGGDGRIVGVITHVQELAIRLPARIEVEKSPRGSTLRVVTEG